MNNLVESPKSLQGIQFKSLPLGFRHRFASRREFIKHDAEKGSAEKQFVIGLEKFTLSQLNFLLFPPLEAVVEQLKTRACFK